jgi:hypothetical protein
VSGLAVLQREFLRELLDASGELAPGLEIYRRGMRANHTGALAATYPVVKRLVGDAFFAEAARRYGEAHASTSGNLDDYGGDFPAFIAAYPHAASLPYLADVARLEWACHECGQAPDVAPFDFAGLAQVAPQAHGDLRFSLHPSVRLVASGHPIVSIHAANAPHRDGTPARAQGAELALVHRDEGQARVVACDAADFASLQALARGDRLADASALPQSVARWVACGVISAFHAPPCAR